LLRSLLLLLQIERRNIYILITPLFFLFFFLKKKKIPKISKMFALTKRSLTPLMGALSARSMSNAAALAPISHASLAALDSRWVRLPECEKGAIADHVSVLEKGDWKQMSLGQKRAGGCLLLGLEIANCVVKLTPKDSLLHCVWTLWSPCAG
jgi:hypothetical protein